MKVRQDVHKEIGTENTNILRNKETLCMVG